MSTQRLIALNETKEHPDIALGKQLVQKMKDDGIICEDDFIATRDMPFCYEDELHIYEEKFGKEKLKQYLEHGKKTKMVRDAAKNIHKTIIGDNGPAPLSTLTLAITRFGVGECQERTNLLTKMLADAGCKRPITSIAISQNYRTDKNYMHCFVIVGDTSNIESKLASKNTNNLSLFAELNDDCILLDAKLRVYGKAKDLVQLYEPYINAYGYNRINGYSVCNPALANKEKALVEANAQLICEMIREQTGIPFKQAKVQLESKKETPTVVDHSKLASESRLQKLGVKQPVKPASNNVTTTKAVDLNDAESLMKTARILVTMMKELQNKQNLSCPIDMPEVSKKLS